MEDNSKAANIFNNSIVALNALFLTILIGLLGVPKIDIILISILLAGQIFFRLYPVPLLRSSFLSLAFLPFIIIFIYSGYLTAAIFALISILIADGFFKRKGFINGLWLGSHFSFAMLLGGLIYKLLGGSYAAEALKVDNYSNLAIFLFSYFIIQVILFYLPLILSQKVEFSEMLFCFKWEAIVFFICIAGSLSLLWFYFNQGANSLLYFIPLVTLTGWIIKPIIEKAILTEELSKIIQTGALIAANLNLENTMKQTEKLMRRVIEFENFFLALAEPSKNQLKLIYDSRKGFLDDPTITDIKEGISGLVYQEGRPLIIKDSRKIKGRIEMAKGMRSEMILPVKFGQEIVGVIDLEHPLPDHFSSRDLAMLSYMVNYIAIVIHFYHMLQPLVQISFQARSFIDELTSSLQQINAGAQEISSTLSQMSQEMNKQKEMLEQESQSINAVFESSGSIAEHSSLADQKNKDASEIVDSNRADIERTALTLLEAQKIIQSIASEVKSFQASFNKIKDFINVIIGIARQTTVLSINASIEAAKAGDYGKGFSVVAQEISKLAEESNKASEEISASIEHIKEKLEQLIKQALTGEEKVRDASAIEERFHQALLNILDATSQSNQLVNQIAYKTEQQRNEIAKITYNTSQLDQINRKNFEGTQDIVSAVNQQTASLQIIYTKASKLEDLINTINQLINRFTREAGAD